MAKLRLIGDVHGYTDVYLSLINEADYSIQLGDFGFDYNCLTNVDPNKHRILLGNHEAYNKIHLYPHFLGDFGVHTIGNFDCFYIRGAYSIDKQYRRMGFDWFKEEELNYEQSTNLIHLYEYIKPKLVISHECPSDIVELISAFRKKFPLSYTQKLLQALFDLHKPKTWLHAHHHVNKIHYYGKTLFICLKELGFVDFEIEE